MAGLEKIAEMTKSGTWELEVDLMDWVWKDEESFLWRLKVGSLAQGYELTAAKYDFSSTARCSQVYNGAPLHTTN